MIFPFLTQNIINKDLRTTLTYSIEKVMTAFLVIFFMEINFVRNHCSYLLSRNNLIFLKICKWCYCFEWVPNQSFSFEWQLSFTDWITVRHNIGHVCKHWVFTLLNKYDHFVGWLHVNTGIVNVSWWERKKITMVDSFRFTYLKLIIFWHVKLKSLIRMNMVQGMTKKQRKRLLHFQIFSFNLEDSIQLRKCFCCVQITTPVLWFHPTNFETLTFENLAQNWLPHKTASRIRQRWTNTLKRDSLVVTQFTVTLEFTWDLCNKSRSLNLWIERKNKLSCWLGDHYTSGIAEASNYDCLSDRICPEITLLKHRI